MNATHVLEINAGNDGTVIPVTVTLPNSRVGCARCMPARGSLLPGRCRAAAGHWLAYHTHLTACWNGLPPGPSSPTLHGSIDILYNKCLLHHCLY